MPHVEQVAAMVAAADSTGLDTAGPFINLGAIGVLCLVLVQFARGAYADAIRQRDEAQDQLDELNRELRDKTVPALVEANRTMTRVVALLDEQRR